MSHSCKRKDGNVGCISCVAYGVVEERERIIELLEEWYRFDADLSKGIEPLIALIKGEK